MLLGIRLVFLFLITAPVMFLSSQFVDGNNTASYARYFMSEDYSEQWKAVDKALDEGLPKTALELVEAIYTRAKTEDNQPQLVRAITYRVALRAVINEEEEVVLVRDLEKELEASSESTRSILTSMLADMYWNYYQANRWRINDRTQVEDAPEDDFRSWDATVFFDTTATLYRRSLAGAAELQKLPVKDWQEILYGGNLSGKYRPTMYDVLAHRALEFFENDEVDLPSPQQDFEVTDLQMLAPVTVFMRTEITSPNPANPRYQALRLYQQLLRFHAGRNDATALVDLDLLRLDFAQRITWHEDKDTTYYQAVLALHDSYRNEPISTQAGYYLARYQHELGNYPAALERCRTEDARFPDSRGAINCRALESGILQKEVQLTVEESMKPDAPILLSVGWRNVKTVYFRVVALPSLDRLAPRQNYRDRDEWLSELINRKAVHAWTQQLPDKGDYKLHRSDLRAPALPLGNYMILMSADRKFSLDENAIAYANFQVTRLSLQSFQEGRGDHFFWVMDAVDGHPIKDARVEMYTRKWRSSQNSHELVLEGSRATDGNGKFVLNAGRHRDGVMFRVMAGKDTLTIGESFYAWRSGQSNTQRRTLFFTDRAIYRPGQTVHVKGIVLEGNPSKADFKVVPDVTSTVVFYDVNHQKIHEMELRTNSYGSFNTTFTVPSGVLTGMMRIQNNWGSAGVRVEEYKRPKFEAEFEPVKGNYGLNDIVKVSGIAKAYAGSNIDGADVSWRVVRKTRYPYWYWWWRPMPRGEDREIAHGRGKTDGDGRFTLEFEAIPDKSIDRSTLPVFTYEITADVIDINGETHSASTNVSAGYTSIELSLSVPSVIERSDEQTLMFHARNLDGQPVAADGTVVLEKLETPDRILRSRYLPEPDTWVLSEQEFRRDFPHDIYRNENVPATWDVERQVMGHNLHMGEEGVDSLRLADLNPGSYRLTYSVKDPSGEDLTLLRTFTVFEEGAALPVPTAEFFVAQKTTAEPGETARFLFGSGFDRVHALYRVDFHGETQREEWQTLSSGARPYELAVEEKHRGGFSANVSFVRDYRLYQRSVSIHVPWSNKQLSVETTTFRDKLRPGQKEEWKITIKGPARDRVAAELLASMYDASLDAIYTTSWPRFSWPSYARYLNMGAHSFGGVSAQLYIDDWNTGYSYYSQSYDRLNLFLLGQGGRYYGRHMYKSQQAMGMGFGSGVQEDAMAMRAAPAAAEMEADGLAMGNRAEKKEMVLDEEMRDKDDAGDQGATQDGALDMVKARTNFNETAFFYPDLMTDEDGNVVLRFTVPEALTRWKLRLFAHTPDLKTGYLEKTTVTQKELMVMPNMPRFLRESDRVVLMTKISNLSDSALQGTVTLKLFDALSMQPVDEKFSLRNAGRNFSVEAGRSTTAQWEISIPEGSGPIVYRVVARAGDFSDGEEMALPVLPNRMLVTESMPMNIRGGQTRSFTFEKLVNSASSSTLTQHQLTLEMTSHPAWYAVQALPYLMEYPYECSEQVFSRYYANSIASHIVNSNPKIKRVFDQWKNTDALLSNLQKNQDLKMLLLEETPWVLQGKDESERKKRIALLFDLNHMSQQLDNAMLKLEKAQASNGGWPWFPGMPESRYITQYIIAGFGHLAELGITPKDERVQRMLRRAVQFMDDRMNADYMELKRRERSFDEEKDYLSQLEIQYLYARSYFMAQDIPSQYDEAVSFWQKESRKWWARRGYMAQGMIALALHRFKEKDVPQAIVRSLRERAMQNDEMGMYWKYGRGWFWYQAPIEAQAMLIEVFDVVANDGAAVDEMKIWLLKQKQVQDWGSTVSTAEACYALLRRGSDLLASDKLVEVTMGGERIDPRAMGAQVEAGSGHYRIDWHGGEIKPSMGNVTVKKEDKGIAWGAVYWQYFEQLDKITPAQTPLQIEKELYLQRNTDKGVVLEPITEDNVLKVGDVVKVRVVLRVDRDMEYVHLKDMRGAGLELINQLSGYHWKGGLGYYEAPRDASVNFFFHWLNKGVHVFEYPLRVSHAGEFSNGISSIQCMYAPEFTAHTAGIRVTVAK